jgi:predicted nucleic acid-binding protein
MPVVANSSPLIYLAALSDFHFLRDLFGPIAIPPAVYQEVVEHGSGFPVQSEVKAALDDWVAIKAVQNGWRIEEICESACLDLGEAEAIILAQECQAERLLLDDQRAVGYARELGLNVTRTPVIYFEAKLRGWIPSVREKLDALRKKGFRLSERHYRRVLKEIGES